MTKRYIKESYFLKDIPLNDIDAFEKYKELRYLYDKLFIAKSQGLTESMTEYVVVRPRINLCGMGRDAKVLHKSKVKQKDFWVEYLLGQHISLDIFINTNYGIQATIAFEGTKTKNFGSFNYWIFLPNYRLKKHIKEWILKYVKNYNGIINIEIIGDYIIECHLRLGDLDKFQDKKILQSVVDTYNNKKINVYVPYTKFYLIPIFAKRYKKISKPKSHENLLFYEIDNENMSHPLGEKRLGMLYVDNLKYGLLAKKNILSTYNE